VVHPFESLAKQGRWEEVENVLNCCNADFDYAAPVGDTFSHGDPILHMVCRNHPPVSIVQRLLQERSPALAMREVNTAGQTPPHVAAASGASFRVVHYLVEQCDDPDMVAAQDLEGNTPLHLHFSHTCGKKVRDPGFLVPTRSNSTFTSIWDKVLPPSCNCGPDVPDILVLTKQELWRSPFQIIKARGITKPSRGTKIINSTDSRCSLALAKRDSFTQIDDKVKQFHRLLELEHHNNADHADVLEEKFLVQGPTQEIVNDLANTIYVDGKR
jgi:hypothetical protein